MQQIAQPESIATRTPSRRAERLINGAIVCGGVLVLFLLAWGHLGLGAAIMPPALSAPQQVATVGPYQVTLLLDSGALHPGTHNSATVLLRDTAGQPLDGAKVIVTPEMTTMAMATPVATGVALGGGRYQVNPAFAMAGSWRLKMTIARGAEPARQVSFDVGVRW